MPANEMPPLSLVGESHQGRVRSHNEDNFVCISLFPGYYCAAVADGGVYESALDQREIKRIAHQNSDYHILLLDSTKLAGQGTYFVAPLSSYEVVSVDRYTDADLDTLRGARLV